MIPGFMSKGTGFEITHFSIHQGGDDGLRWIDVNLVFKVDDEHRMYVEGYCSDWVRGVIYQVDDVREITNFYESESGGELLGRKHPAYRSGFMMNDYNFLVHLKKFDVYRFHEIVEDNRITRAAIRELAAMNGDGGNDIGGRFMAISRLTRCLATLNIFWD